MSDTLSPEEKLLRLIKGAGRHAAEHKTAVRAAAAPAEASVARPAEALPAKGPRKAVAWQHIVLRVLLAALIGSGIYLAFALVYPFFAFGPVPAAPLTPEPGADQTQSARQPVEYYTQAPLARQLFSGEESSGASGLAGVATADILKEISLVGIISGDNPQAVIEDKRSQKTLYVAKGQSVGAFLVAEILEGKIILNYKGQRYELYL